MSAIIRSWPTFDSRPFAAADDDDNQRVARLCYLARRIHALGERPLLELLRELDAGAELLPTLERYARLPGELIKAHGGDRLYRFVVFDGDEP